MATCTEVVEVAAFINHPDRRRPQAQRGLNVLEPWAHGLHVAGTAFVGLENKYLPAAKSW